MEGVPGQGLGPLLGQPGVVAVSWFLKGKRRQLPEWRGTAFLGGRQGTDVSWVERRLLSLEYE